MGDLKSNKRCLLSQSVVCILLPLTGAAQCNQVEFNAKRIDMADYVLVESRDPFEYTDTEYFYQVAADLSNAGNNVTFFLVQNGVLTVRKGMSNSVVAKLQTAAPSVKILADEFSLRERAIADQKLTPGVVSSDVDQLVDLLAVSGVKAIWH
ncbi:uncharacterized protein METZ01_LOCUS303414 [marine metagenome]|uniref:Uncharacterized protein n=1 Tax=marine metagenome TaxID=408172 RepID=A0A382MPM5_9ZZZZ